MADNMQYDEDLAIKYIRNYVGEEISAQWSDDEILYVTDIIWDYYERNGNLRFSPAVTEEELAGLDKLVAFVKKELKNDKYLVMDPKDVDMIVKGELAYEESLEDVDED